MDYTWYLTFEIKHWLIAVLLNCIIWNEWFCIHLSIKLQATIVRKYCNDHSHKGYAVAKSNQ